MKVKHILPFVGVAIMVCLFACQKSRYCFCVTDQPVRTDTIYNSEIHQNEYFDRYDTSIVNLDRSMKCKVLMQMGHEQIVNGQTTRDYYKYNCVQIDKDTVPTIPNLPREE